jgi:GTP-binding protein
VTTYIKLPLGTSIYDSDTNELLADILESGQTYVVCQGGKAGHGNAFFKSSFNRAPTLYENGDAGEEKNITLKLRFLADVGLVGLPNAGKSTLVNQISNAKPRIANYQFTTLIPVLGVVNIKDHKLVFADMPGLIEGAAKGKGLGHDFLKHIERCQIFIHLISLNPIDSDDVVKSYKIVTNELKKYSKELLKKPIIIVANKIDTEGAKENLEKLKKSIKKNIFVISAKNNEGVNELLNEIYKEYDVIQKTNEQKLKNKSQGIKVIEVKQQKDYHKDLRIIKVDDDK